MHHDDDHTTQVELSPLMNQISLAKYVDDLKQTGTFAAAGSGGMWTALEGGAVIRRPLFCFNRPDPAELRRLFWRHRVLIATYLMEPDAAHPANAVLYACSDPNYELAQLSTSMRRNTRHALRDLAVNYLTPDMLLDHGLEAFCDTRLRNGLTDGTNVEFRRRYASRARSDGHVYLGAWKGSQLAGFLSIIQVDDWAEIEGCFTVTSLLAMKPNEALLFTALSHYLRSRRFRLVTSGLSSVQEVSHARGLDEFKRRVGFEAKPVHRAFAFHPLLRPLANATTNRCVGLVTRLAPGSRRLNKISGVLHMVTGGGTTGDDALTDGTVA